MRFFSRDKPKIKIETTKKDSYSGWLKCTSCQELIHTNELQHRDNCCPKCDYHYRLSVDERIASVADEGSFEEKFFGLQTLDVLNFVDEQPYTERIANAKAKSEHEEAVLVGTCRIQSIRVALAVMDFNFMGGSMGSVVGEKLTRLIEYAIEERIAVIIVSTSGGARMQESTFSLMQMAKVSAALQRLDEEKLPYISVLTNPTSGGVTASFASLGDIIIAEPNALICFAGPRVIEQTIGHKLPEGAQKSEFLLKHGMIDCIVTRREIKNKLASICRYLTHNQGNKNGNTHTD